MNVVKMALNFHVDFGQPLLAKEALDVIVFDFVDET